MDGNDKLADSTLFKSLNATCGMLIVMLESLSEDITAEQIAQLPDYVFNVAVNAGWIPEPIGGPSGNVLDSDHVCLGWWVVRRTYREEFVALIQEALSGIEPVNDEVRRRWREDEERERREAMEERM